MAVLAAVRLLKAIILALVRPYRPETGLLLNDISSPIFALGFLCAKDKAFWVAVRPVWRTCLGLRTVAAIVLVIILSHNSPIHAHTD